MKTVLLVCGAVVYLTTATVVAYAVRAALLSRISYIWKPAPALVIGWIIGLAWPALVIIGAASVSLRRLKGSIR